VPSITILLKLGILLCSLVIGIIFFYVTKTTNRNEKKQQIDQFLSYLINFILFIWAGKIVLQLPLLFRDPFAILAYPSDSRAVYVATFLLIIQITYHLIRKKLHLFTLMETAIPIFTAALFMYEFLQMIIQGNQHALPNLLLLSIFVLGYIFIQDKQPMKKVMITYMIVFCLAHVCFHMIFSYTTVFGYMLHPIYFISIILISMSLFICDRQGHLKDQHNKLK